MENNVPPKHITKTRVEFFIYASLLMTNILVLPVFLLVNKTVGYFGDADPCFGDIDPPSQKMVQRTDSMTILHLFS